MIDKSLHLQRMMEATKELQILSRITAEPADIPIQYIGTVTDNTMVLLTAPANSLDGGDRRYRMEDRNWISVMQAVHRSFFSGIHSTIEKALTEICRENGWVIENTSNKKIAGIISDIEMHLTPYQRKTLEKMAGKAPSFADCLNTVLKNKVLPLERKKFWRKFFQGLSLIRNKVSHSDPTLSLKDTETLKDAGFAQFVVNGELQANSRMYWPVSTTCIQFFQELGYKANS